MDEEYPISSSAILSLDLISYVAGWTVLFFIFFSSNSLIILDLFTVFPLF